MLRNRFFESQPELAESFEELPALRAAPNDADRKKMVRIIQVLVFHYASYVLFNVTASSAEVGAVLSSTGVGGLTVAAVVRKPVGKRIDKMADDAPIAASRPMYVCVALLCTALAHVGQIA